MRRLPVVAGSHALVAALAACGPASVASAERSCLQDARLAQGPRGAVTMGVVSDGGRVRPATSFEIEVSGDSFAGRDPAVVFDNCVRRRSGQLPTRPLYAQQGWGG